MTAHGQLAPFGMDAFPARLEAAADRYRYLQGDDGGWGEDRWEGAPTSIVNTVEVLHVLRSAHVLYGDPTVQRALKYLERAVEAHPRPESKQDPEARGAHTRYSAWGLSGLTLYPEGRQDVRWLAAQRSCVTWLAKHRLSGASSRAWGEGPGDEHPSLLSTVASVIALDRLTGYHPAATEAAALAASARNVIVSVAQESRGQAWWPQVASESRPSPSATALAVLALLHGNVGQRGVATMGARWLRENHRMWQGKVETESSARGANWDHMTFSLALRAVVLGEGRVDPGDLLVRSAVRYMHELWSDEDAEWCHGRPGARSSPSGSYAVVMAHDALRRVWPFDALVALDGTTPRVRRFPPTKTEAQLHVDEQGMITVTDLNGDKVVSVKLPQRLEEIVVACARRHCVGAHEATLDGRSCGLDELRLRPDLAPRYVHRINTKIRDAAEGPVGDIVQLMRNDSGERRCIVNTDRVTLHERWMEPG